MLSSKASFLAAAAILLRIAAAGSFDCEAAFSNCLEINTYPGGADYCASQHASCLDCSNAEDACRAAGASTNYSNSIECTTAAQICYHNAFGTGTVNGAYSCEQAHNTCVTARGTTFSFCASQEAACTPCVQEENECRTAPGANQSYCASQAAECWGRAMEG